MATSEARLQEFAAAVAAECRAIRLLLNGNAPNNNALTTFAKNNFIAAVNEISDRLITLSNAVGAQIDDASTTSTTETHSAARIVQEIATAISDLKAFFDANGDGKVNAAEQADGVPWSGVQGKPASYAPAPHDASLITSGKIDPARLPILTTGEFVISSGGLSALTVEQQAEVVKGTTVTTTDGRRWLYTGAGDKTLAASYIEMADVTPEWAVIANKPTSLSGYGITDAQARDATLTALAALNTAADRLIYATGSDAFATTVLTSFARSLLDDASASAARTTLGALSTAEIGNPDTDLAAVFTASLV